MHISSLWAEGTVLLSTVLPGRKLGCACALSPVNSQSVLMETVSLGVYLVFFRYFSALLLLLMSEGPNSRSELN